MKQSLWAVFLGIAFIIGVYLASNAFVHRNKDLQVIHVKGMSQQNFESDLIVWSASFSRTSYDLKDAYRQIANDRKVIESYLAKKGISSREITFEAVDVQKLYHTYYDENDHYQRVFDGYQLTQELKIQSQDVNDVEALSREISELIDKGIYIISEKPKYYYTKLDELKIRMIAEATKNARIRAEQVATQAGVKLGKLQKARLGIFQITGQYSDEDYTWGGAFNTSSKAKTATVTVTADFSIK